MNCFIVLTLECHFGEFECNKGRVDGQRSPCISVEQLCDGIIDCIGEEDELDHNCPCGPEGSVRLVDGIVPHRGRVEFCKSGRWSTICNNWYYYRHRWNDNDAAVVCHQLGYRTTGT